MPEVSLPEERDAWLAEYARLRSELLLARQELEQTRTERERLLSQMREANERLVIASVRADELADRADAGRRRAETLAAELASREATMREGEEQLRAALVAGKMAHWRWDPETDVVIASETMDDILGLLEGTRYQSRAQGLELIHPDDVQGQCAVVEAARRERRGWKREFRIVRPRDQEIAWLEESATVVHSAAAQWELVGLVRDVTERKRVEELLRDEEHHARALLSEAMAARGEAEAASRAKDEFLATVSHELRTPLAGILLWARALGTAALEPTERARAIDAIVQSARSQSQLIEDLLELSRITSDSFTLAVSAVDLAVIVADAVDMVQPMMAAKALNFRVEVEPASIVASLDARRMKQILVNVLANAAKFTPSGGAVRLIVRAREGSIDVTLSDTGEGIAAAFMPHVFERFRQADMSDTRPHKGLGIGLAITKQLVELHGGTIEAQSEGIGRGSSFHIQIPWRQPENGWALRAEAAVSTSAASRLSGLRIVLVESDTNTRDAMQWTLAREGAHVAPLDTGGAALNAIQGSSADIIISELGLPDMSGFELMKRIVDLSRTSGRPALPSCAVSAHTRPDDRRLAIEAGFDMFLAKPVTPEELVEAVSDLREVLAPRSHS